MKILGKATLEGTNRYREKYQETCAFDHFRKGNRIITSSIGIGTYLGEKDEQTNKLVTEAIIKSVLGGINLIDSAIIYRDSKGERSVGQAIKHLINIEKVSRDELTICTKGGFLTHETPEYLNWFCQHYGEQKNSNLNREDIVINDNQRYHCVHPDYVEDQINQSLENLGLETIDIYYIHNPEIQLAKVDSETFYHRLQLAFEAMENAVNCGKIGAYGLATWNGLRVPQNSQEHLDLAKIKSIAMEVSGSQEDNFRYIQFPLNMGMPEAFSSLTQKIEGEEFSLLEAAERLGLFSIASASLCQAEVIGRIPDNIISTFGDKFATDCQRALQYARSTPGLLAALVGMKNSKHVEENLSINVYSPFEKPKFKEITDLIAQVI